MTNNTPSIDEMTGEQSASASYKLNEITMSGDSGDFTLIERLGKKGDDGRYQRHPLGQHLEGVVLKMRWRLYKYEENKPSMLSSEYDQKSDHVVIFSTNEKRPAAELKERYALPSQRVLYVWLPERKEIVRLIVKSSALTGEKNPAAEKGLFDYCDYVHNQKNSKLRKFFTRFEGVYRKDEKNPRKSYYAMTFADVRSTTPDEDIQVEEMIKDVYSKTSAVNFVDAYEPPTTTDAPAPSDEDVDVIGF
jgi:hypothetical protein